MQIYNREPTRLSGFDYSTPGAYFLTLCVKDHKQILSKIIVGDGVLDVPENQFTDYGKIANEHLEKMVDFYDSIKIDKYVVMPNHVHMIISVLDVEKNEVSEGPSRMPVPTNSSVANFVRTFKRFCNRQYGKNIWQRSYHDHIIRDKNDYEKIWNYIDTNVIRWKNDCYYSE